LTSTTKRTRRDDDQGVVFPRSGEGRRASAAPCQAVFVDALAAGSAESAARASIARPWHATYPSHVRETVRVSLADSCAALALARAGLASLHERLEFVRGAEVLPLARFEEVAAQPPLGSVALKGSGAPAPRPLSIPYRGELLQGDRLERQLDRWQEGGIIEPTHAQAIREVASHPEWLDLSDRSFVLLGASAEVGPLAWLAGWRARIVAIDLPDERTWQRVARCVHEGNGGLIAPTRERSGAGAGAGARTSASTDTGADSLAGEMHDAASVSHAVTGAGVDLLTDLPEIARWLATLEGPMTVGAYAYLDGAAHVRVSAAMDALMAALTRQREDVSLAMLATPTDVYAVSADAVRESRRRYAARGPGARLWQEPIALTTGGRFFQPNYPAQEMRERHAADGGATDATVVAGGYGVCDSIVLQQGPNYALAKRLQQWRALAARDDGVRVSINVAPSTMTNSVVKNPALAAAFAGAHHFGVESFEAATTSALMAALLVYDLRSEGSPANPSLALSHPLELLAHGANHGGMWRMPFIARSALPVAAALGWMRRSRSR
jgi:hypothetical protein